MQYHSLKELFPCASRHSMPPIIPAPLHHLPGIFSFVINLIFYPRDLCSALVLDVPGVAAPIRYEVISGELIRNGPPINAQGRLVDSSASDALVVRSVVDFDVDTSNARQPTYRISVQDSNGFIYKTASADGAQCRVRSIKG
jgi:hypothetical protein